MSERFPDKVLREAIEAYESHEDYRAVEAMRAVLEGHLAENLTAVLRERFGTGDGTGRAADEGFDDVVIGEIVNAITGAASDGSPR